MDNLPMILLYDASLNSDWISRYALAFAAAAGEKLTVFHILDGKNTADTINHKINELAQNCSDSNIDFETNILPMQKNVALTILERLGTTTETVICGTRIRHKNKGYIKNTISEQLIKTGKFNLLALRVVQPGLLGHPASVFFPLKENCVIDNITPFLGCMKDFPVIHFSAIQEFRPVYINNISYRHETHVRHELMERLAACVSQSDIYNHIHEDSVHLHTSITENWKKEVLILAGRLKSDFIMIPWQKNGGLLSLFRGNPVEYILKKTPIDTGVYFSK